MDRDFTLKRFQNFGTLSEKNQNLGTQSEMWYKLWPFLCNFHLILIAL